MLSVARDPLHCLSVSLSLLITFAVARRPRRACWQFLPCYAGHLHYCLLHSTSSTYCMCLVLFSDRPTYLRSTYNNKLRFTPSLKRHLPHILTLEPCLVLPYLVWAPSSPRALQTKRTEPLAQLCVRERNKEGNSSSGSIDRVVAQRGSHHTGSPTTAQNEPPSPRHLTPQSIADQPRHFCLRQLLFIGHGSGVHGRQPERPALGAAHPLLTSRCPSWHVMIVSTSCASSTTTTLLAISSRGADGPRLPPKSNTCCSIGFRIGLVRCSRSPLNSPRLSVLRREHKQ